MNQRVVVLTLAVALIAGCAQIQKTLGTGSGTPPAATDAKPSGRIEDVTELRATVTAIDAAKRLVTVKDETGESGVFELSDAVRNLDQVKVGDEVVLSYTEAIAWAVRPPGKGGPGVSSQESVATAESGQKPSAEARQVVTLTTTITGIDLDRGTVTLQGPQGRSRTLRVRDTANLRKAKVGDLVDIAYSEAVALAVRPAKKP
jgi:Cu/Ag efflux protein CusF